MIVCTEKTVYQVLKLSTTRRSYNITYSGTLLKEERLSSYLGVNLNRKLNLNEHIKKAAEKSTNRLRLIKRSSITKYHASSITLKTQVTPIIKAEQLAQKFGILHGNATPLYMHNTIYQSLPLNPMTISGLRTIKSDTFSAFLKQLTLGTIDKLYPQNNWL